jgi:chaperonin cofactor prefoldin
MTTAQYLNAYMPTLIIMVTILLGVVSNNRRLDDLRSDMNKRFEIFEKRFEIFERQFEIFERRFDRLEERLAALEQRVTALEHRVAAFAANILGEVKRLEERFGQVAPRP